MTEGLLAAENAMDHLLLGVPVLEQGIAWVTERTGIQAARGGQHPGMGTHNALLSLGQKQYLEIIAPDPTQTMLASPFAFLQTVTAPNLLTWAAATNDIQRVAAQARLAGLAVDGPHPGARTRPDGQTLRWQTLFLKSDFRLLIPFFIEWDVLSQHPSESAPGGCTLHSFTFAHPQPERLRAAFNHLGIDAEVTFSSEARLEVALASPNGFVTLA